MGPRNEMVRVTPKLCLSSLKEVDTFSSRTRNRPEPSRAPGGSRSAVRRAPQGRDVTSVYEPLPLYDHTRQ